MTTMETIVFGKIDDGAVGSALKTLRPHVSDRSTCIVRSIDSIHDCDDLNCALAAHRIKCSIIDGNVCIRGSELYAAIDAGMFSGFDEIWLFRDAPAAFTLAGLPGATSDTTDFGKDFPEVLRQAFEESRCALLLADGNGLNYAYATSDRPIARVVEGVLLR
ncbi:MAG: hypothetical protein WAW79_00050 [Steroidobacteraceae bacterium]